MSNLDQCFSAFLDTRLIFTQSKGMLPSYITFFPILVGFLLVSIEITSRGPPVESLLF